MERTGEDVQSLQATNPELLARKTTQNENKIVSPINGLTEMEGWTPNPRSEPLQDQRVRWAMSMAINRDSIVNDFYLGMATKINWFFNDTDAVFPPLDDWPRIMEEVHGVSPEEAKYAKLMMEYHPDMAKELLAEAGYPNGFETSMLIQEIDVQLANVLVAMLADIGIDAKLKVVERSAFRSATDTRTYEALHLRSGTMAGWGERWSYLGPNVMEGKRRGSNTNAFRDPYVNGAQDRAYATYNDIPARTQIIADFIPYTLWLGWWINIPAAWEHSVWQPWVRNYNGEYAIGYRNENAWVQYVWIDQDMKAEMLGQ
jgi:peptide/nickel transport system substrate-binding protein